MSAGRSVASTRSTAIAVIAFAAAMAFVEAAVVVDLRAALGVGDAIVPLVPVASAGNLVTIEVGREAATLVMLAAVGWIAGRGGLERLAWAAVAFGAWDIGYYAWLRVFVGWPGGLDTPDVLFLIPVPWIGPVWAPVVVSLALVGFGLAAAARIRASGPLAVAGLAGGLVVILSFTIDAGTALGGRVPSFAWPLFAVGMLLALAAAVAALLPPSAPTKEEAWTSRPSGSTTRTG
jgi:hypothetical protein